MTEALLRKKIHKYVDQVVDEKTLRLLNAFLTEALIIQNESESFMTDEQFAEVEHRVKSLEEGKSKMLPWEEVKARILKKDKPKRKKN